MNSAKRFPPVFEDKLIGMSEADQEIFSRSLSAARHYQLIKNPIKSKNYDLKHLANIHKYLFQDVSSYAGVVREYGIRKGASKFADPTQMSYLSENELPKRIDVLNHSVNDKNKYVDGITDLHSTLDLIHPFREGNGRATRVFMSQLAKEHGYKLSFPEIDKDRWVKACIHSIQSGKETLKRPLFEKIITSTRERNELTSEQEAKKNQLKTIYKTQQKFSAIKSHPELEPLYPLISAAKLMAEKHTSNRQDQQRIINKVEEVALTKLAKGEQLPSISKTKESALDHD